MMRKVLLLLLWFPLTFILLIVNLAFLATTSHLTTPSLPLSATAPNEQSGVTASSGTPEVLSASVIAGDARTLLLESFFNRNKSPMTSYAGLIVREADRNGFDFRLLPAIAMCESNLGKRMPLKAGFNPFGIAVYTGTLKGKNFDSWEHAVVWVSEYLKAKYFDRGIKDLKEIGAIWAPPSVETDYSWTSCVEYFMDSISLNGR